MVNIRSASYTSSYSSPMLTIPTPGAMVPGDLLICFLVALSKYSGNFFYKGIAPSIVELIVGNPPPGWSVSSTGPTLPHDPPVAVLAVPAFAMHWVNATDSGYTGCWWSNLGSRLDDGTWVTSGLTQWPWQSSWYGASPTSPSEAGRSRTPNMASVTVVGRYVTGSEPSLSFTLNIPNDSDYDYRGMALCLSGDVDLGGTYYDNPAAGGSGIKQFEGGPSNWSTTSARRDGFRFDDIAPSGHKPIVIGAGQYADASGGGHHYAINLRDLDAFIPQGFWSWPPFLDFTSDPSSPVASYPEAPPDDLNAGDLLLHLIAYAGDTSFGDPTAIVVSDQSATPPVSPLTVLHQETWSKSPNTLHIRLSQTRPSSAHDVDSDGTGLVTITSPIVAPEGPITLPAVGFDAAVAEPQIYTTGLALVFRVRSAYPAPVLTPIPARLATIVG